MLLSCCFHCRCRRNLLLYKCYFMSNTSAGNEQNLWYKNLTVLIILLTTCVVGCLWNHLN